VITNEREYRITKAARRRFEKAIEAHKNSVPGEEVDPRVHALMADAMRSEVEVLSGQIQRYEDLRDGRIAQRELDGLADLPTALIEARIAAGLTQKGLADRLGLKEQQIQRWESDRYSGVGLTRIQEVIDALGMGITETVRYAAAA
jgi:ribosome-binding protein aMBF1 (putative translation factor)